MILYVLLLQECRVVSLSIVEFRSKRNLVGKVRLLLKVVWYVECDVLIIILFNKLAILIVVEKITNKHSFAHITVICLVK